MVDNYYDHLSNEQLKQLMNSNNLDAYYYYALRVIDSDIQEAIDCLVHAAKNGHVLSAEYYSEFLYEIIASRGFNINDPDDARFMIGNVKFLESIVDSTPAVPYFLSLIFYGDYLGEPDVDKALRYMNMAADKEFPPAFDWLGNYYSDGP